MTASSWFCRAARFHLPGALLLAGIALASYVSGVHPGDLTRDPTAVLQVSPFTGLLSNIGVLLWCAAAAVLLFSAALLHGKGAVRNELLFFLSAAGITLAVLIDDLFRLHDYIFPYLLHIRGEVFYALYFLALSAFLGRFRGTLVKSGIFDRLAQALVFLGLSVVLDAFFDSGRPWHFLIEDGFKFLGIVSWAAFMTGISLQAVSGKVRAFPEPAGITFTDLFRQSPRQDPRGTPVPQTFHEVTSTKEVNHVV